jgi:hypothetical protein
MQQPSIENLKKKSDWEYLIKQINDYRLGFYNFHSVINRYTKTKVLRPSIIYASGLNNISICLYLKINNIVLREISVIYDPLI